MGIGEGIPIVLLLQMGEIYILKSYIGLMIKTANGRRTKKVMELLLTKTKLNISNL